MVWDTSSFGGLFNLGFQSVNHRKIRTMPCTGIYEYIVSNMTITCKNKHTERNVHIVRFRKIPEICS